jgi:hypothetical protein
VGSWGALGWRLPLPWHMAAQLVHMAAAAWRLAPAVSRDGGLCWPVQPSCKA